MNIMSPSTVRLPKSEHWGLSIEGHHCPLNFSLQGDKIVDSTPQFFATNPAELKAGYGEGFDEGLRVIREKRRCFRSLEQAERRSTQSCHAARQDSNGNPRCSLNHNHPKPPQKLARCQDGCQPERVAETTPDLRTTDQDASGSCQEPLVN